MSFVSDSKYYRVTRLTPEEADITADVVSVNATFQGTGLLCTARLELDGADDRFIRGNTGAPSVGQFDRFRIEFSDWDNNIKSKIFEVDTILPQLTEKGGYVVALELVERARALQDMKTTAYYLFKTPRFILNDLCERYKVNRGLDQPLLYMELPDALDSVTMMVDLTGEWSYYDAFNHIIERLADPVETGGMGEHFGLVIEDHPTDANGIIARVKVQGSGSVPAKDIEYNVSHQVAGRIEPTSATVVLAQGTPDTGTVPNNFHRYISLLEQYRHFPAWQSIPYQVDQLVRAPNGQVYKATSTIDPATGATPPSAGWRPVTLEQFIEDNLPEGPVPIPDSNMYRASMANTRLARGAIQGGLTYDDGAFMDGNLVIRSGPLFRDWAHVRAGNLADIPDEWLFGRNNTDGRPQHVGFRVLVDKDSRGAPWFENGAWKSDRFGNSFENALVIWDGDEWIVRFSEDRAYNSMLAPSPGTVPLDTDPRYAPVAGYTPRAYQVAVMEDARVYEYEPVAYAIPRQYWGYPRTWRTFGTPSPSRNIPRPARAICSWRDVSTRYLANDCFHYPRKVDTVESIIPFDGTRGYRNAACRPSGRLHG